ncbi:alpha/beta hydrolase [Subtercola sp. YIM 133946]|uniref:alpha/beta hydrolase n=1 Tax=Subtercola sp. YIM 133946 TaxID=3118909 RepID=UPI002F94ED2C
MLGALAIVLGAAAAAGLYQVSVQPGAAIVKAVFEAGSEVTPPADYESIAQTVTETRGVVITAPTPGTPDSTLNLYAPSIPHTGLPVVLWIHGGGFISSSADTVKQYVTMLAAQGYVVANLDYSLAPDARYPVALEQANAALSYLGTHATDFGADPSLLFVGGDSAGAQIASELAAVQTNRALADSVGLAAAVTPVDLRGVVLFCGLYDMQTVGSIGFPALRTYLWAYTGARDYSSFAAVDQLSTTQTATNAYPPTFITVGDADPFRSQADELAASLSGRGVPVTSLTWDGTGDRLGHEYQFDFSLPEANTAFTDTVRFLASRSENR